jgi:hypothetical protein
LKISLAKIYSEPFKIKECIQEINNKELSHTDGPIEVSYNQEYKMYRVLNGHHRMMEAFLKGEKTIEAFKSEHVPYMYDEVEKDNKVLPYLKSEWPQQKSKRKNIIRSL